MLSLEIGSPSLLFDQMNNHAYLALALQSLLNYGHAGLHHMENEWKSASGEALFVEYRKEPVSRWRYLRTSVPCTILRVKRWNPQLIHRALMNTILIRTMHRVRPWDENAKQYTNRGADSRFQQ
jgi:hypothetical protein